MFFPSDFPPRYGVIINQNYRATKKKNSLKWFSSIAEFIGRCLRHSVGTPTIKKRADYDREIEKDREGSMCYGTHYAFYPIAAAVGYTVKGGGGSSGGGGFSGDHLPVSGACSCRARFLFFPFFFLPSTLYAGVCVFLPSV